MMVDPIDPRILAARLDPSVGPAGIGQPAAPKGPPVLQPGQPTFAESLINAATHLESAEKNIPDPSKAQDSTDVESLYKQLGALHEMTMDAHMMIAELGKQIVSQEESGGEQKPPSGQE
ncbi:MAG: hypothetical protein ABIH23_07740 [bacterium]